MTELKSKFEKEMGLEVKRIYKNGDEYLFVALPPGMEVGDDPYYITDSNVTKFRHFSPAEDFNLYQNFMKNPVFVENQ